jgi:hypothetical protein
MMTGKEAREKFRETIRDAFARVVRERKGQLESAAAEIGCTRQALEQYAAGSNAGGDVVLMALVRWNLRIGIEDKSGAPEEKRRWDCGALRSKPRKTETQQPIQLKLPLFQAIEDLGEQNLDVRILKKEAGKIELGVEITFPRRLA